MAATELMRNWTQLSQRGVQSAAADRPARAITAAPAPLSAIAKAEVDPPTSVDRLLHAAMGRFTSGLSPASLGLAYADWALHLAASPGKWQQLAEKGMRKAVRLAAHAAEACGDPDCPLCTSRCRSTTGSGARLGSAGRSSRSTRGSS
jgi:polyhydroxyalkanoate synthase